MKWIGIDTGTHTGFAIWEKGYFTELATLALWDALDRVKKMHDNGDDITVVFEDARKRKWIPKSRDLSQMKGRCQGAGSVKRDASIWEEFCKDNGIPYIAQAPGKGMTKWSAEAFGSITGCTRKTSDHARDAALLVFGRK